MKTIDRITKTNGNGHTTAVAPKAKKPVGGLRFKIEYYPNQNIICIHSRKMFPLSQTDPLMRSSFDKATEKKEGEGNRHPLIKSIRRFRGVLKVSSEQFELRIEKAEMFEWEEILPKVRRALKKHFADGKELDEAPSHRPTADYLASLRRQGCDV